MALRLVLMLWGLVLAPWAQAADHAAILLYHHINSETPPSTSVSPAVFRRHLDFLAARGYSVLPLSRILTTLVKGGSLPDKAVAITFDDAYRSVLTTAAPLLEKHGWPFTVFVSTQAVDDGYGDYLSWDDLRELIRAGAEIGNHSYSHAHLVRHRAGESDQQWRARVEADIRRPQRDLHDRLGVTPTLFSYPYGEYTAELQRIVGSLGYFGIAQQSGAVGDGFNKLAVPRFPMATHYEDMRRFAVSVDSRPLPVSKVAGGPRVLVAGESGPHSLAFDLGPGDYRAAQLACYDSGSGSRLQLSRRRAAGVTRVSMPLPKWGAGRRKINCTAPSSHDPGVYFWYSHLWLVKQPDGKWYEE
ncbi:MAG: polysaccharide deacetylase family protein [Gammaproteobacteria bacterium]|jgi:biofilm PGA synthesis lipoprotein PgaB